MKIESGMKFDPSSLLELANRAKLNIREFQKAIQEEHKTIRDYKDHITAGRYDEERLKMGIQQAQTNIVMFEKKIEAERETMRDARAQISYLREKEARLQQVEGAVEDQIEVVEGD